MDMHAETEKDMCVMSRWTWRDRLRERLFPTGYCTLPEPDRKAGDVMVVKTAVYLTMADRLRVLWRGRLVVETKSCTENAVGWTDTASAAWPVYDWRQLAPAQQDGIAEKVADGAR